MSWNKFAVNDSTKMTPCVKNFSDKKFLWQNAVLGRIVDTWWEDIWSRNSEYTQIQMQDWKECSLVLYNTINTTQYRNTKVGIDIQNFGIKVSNM